MSSRKFIGRVALLEQIDQAINAVQTHILCLHGRGGLGKTFTLQEVARRYGQRPNLIIPEILDLADPNMHLKPNVYKQLAHSLGKGKFDDYFAKQREYDQMLQAGGASSEKMAELGHIADEAFRHCFSLITGQKRVILRMDTMEKVQPTESEKLEEEWRHLLFSLAKLENTVVILAGRQSIRLYEWFQKASANGAVLSLLTLSKFNWDETNSYFDLTPLGRDVPDVIRKRIFSLSEGVPILIDLAIGLYGRGADILSIPENQEFEQHLVTYLLKLHQEHYLAVLYMAYVGQIFNAEILGYLLSTTDDSVPGSWASEGQRILKSLEDFTFMKQQPGGIWVLHDEMKRLVATYAWPAYDHMGKSRERLCERMEQYFETQAAKLESRITTANTEIKNCYQQIYTIQSLGTDKAGVEKVRSVQNLNDEIFELRGKVQEWERKLWVYRAEILHYCLKRDFAQGYVLFRKLFEPALRNNKVKYARMLLDTMQVETSAMRGWQYGLPLIEKVVVNTPQERELTRSELESEWLVKQARILNREGNYEQARALCSQVLEEPALNIWLELEAASTLARISEATQRIALYERSVELAHQVADIHPNFERLMLTQLGESYSRQGQWDKALEYYKQALEIAQQLKNQPAVAWILNSISDIYRHNGDVDEAYVYCLRGLHIRREQQSEREIAASSLTLGDIYRDANQPVKALRTYEQAEAIYQRLVDAQGLGTDQLKLACILQEQGYVYWRLLSDEEKANVFFSRAREIYERFGNEYGLTYSYALFGRTSRTNGVKADKMGNLDEAIKLYKESEAHYLKALNLAEKVQDWYQVAEISTSLAVVYHLLGDLEKIEQYQQQVEDIAKRYNYNFLLSRLYEHLGHTACNQKTWQTAAQYYAMACHYMAKYTRAWYQRTVHSVFGRIMTLPSTEAVNVSENILEYWQVTENLREEVPEIIALAQAVIDVFHITPT